MDSTKLMAPMFLLLLVSGTTIAWSQKTRSSKDDTANMLAPMSNVTDGEIRLAAAEEGLESKIRARYTGLPGGKYILDEDEHGKDGEEFEEAEEHEDHEDSDKLQGYHNTGKKVEDESSKSYSDKGAYGDFTEGGSSFDKHHKDHVAENKENENIKAHDAGEKFGSEALKEHKLGKHKEKSVGHKKHGFKNVYHKEEYGDHKTFHDEFLDNDHQHEYDDAHENRQVQGGKFSKGYKREGENKEFNEGDENHAWGKEGHDGFREGHFEKGGHHVGHKQGHKNNEGHHEASGYRKKVASHKRKKGEAPLSGHGAHHGHDQPMYYYKSHGNQVHPPREHSHHVGGGSHGGHYHDSGHHETEPTFESDLGLHEEIFEDHEERSPQKEKEFESDIADKLKHSKHKHGHHALPHADARLPAAVDPQPPFQSHSVSESFSGQHPSADPIKHRVQYGMPKTHHRHNVQHQNPPDMLIRHQPLVSADRHMWNNRFEPHRHHHHHGHSHFKPHLQQRQNAHVPHNPTSHLRSSPYPWWKHSSSPQAHQTPSVNQPMETFVVPQVSTHLPHTGFDAKRFSQPITFGKSQAPSYRRMSQTFYPEHFPRYQ